VLPEKEKKKQKRKKKRKKKKKRHSAESGNNNSTQLRKILRVQKTKHTEPIQGAVHHKIYHKGREGNICTAVLFL
jgi:hypothetical protein